jgi:tetratricopeptide (TPR) repeat protein
MSVNHHYRVRGGCRMLLAVVLGGWSCCLARGADSGRTTSPFGPAIERQNYVLGELASIIDQDKRMLSDGMIQSGLQTLLSEEKKQLSGIGGLYPRTIGRKIEELAGQDRTDCNQLAENQELQTDQYRRLEKGLQTRAADNPDSAYAKLLSMATQGQLTEALAEAGKQIRINQLNNAGRSTNKAIGVLTDMVALLTQKAPGDKPPDQSESATTFQLPLEVLTKRNPGGPQSEWFTTQSDPLGAILQALQQLTELAERQGRVAASVKSQSAGKQMAPELVEEETKIRTEAVALGKRLTLLDPQIDQLIGKAALSIDQAMPGLEKGPLSDAVKPTAQAAEELEAAAGYVRKLWKDILAVLGDYLQNALASGGKGGGSAPPKSLSPEQMERLQNLIMSLLRVTGALAKAIESENGLIERTQAASADAVLAPLKPEQEGIGKAINEGIPALQAEIRGLPKSMANISGTEFFDIAMQFLKDTSKCIGNAADALGRADKAEALKRENESLEAMTHALDQMVQALQRLLGQMTGPPGLTPSSGGHAAGMARKPDGGGQQVNGYLFRLTQQQQETVKRAFSDSFPRRYDRAIKLYYEAIAKEKESAAGAASK